MNYDGYCNFHGCPASQCTCLEKKREARLRIAQEHDMLSDALKECLCLLDRLGYGTSPTAIDAYALLDSVFTPGDIGTRKPNDQVEHQRG